MRFDKNTIIGFLLISLILLGFSWYNQTVQEKNIIENAKNLAVKAKEDSLRIIAEQSEAAKLQTKLEQEMADSANALFYARQANDGVSVIENELLKLTIANKGGQIVRAELKDSTYKSNNIKGRENVKKGDNIVLFDQNDSELNFLINGKEQNIKTAELYFRPETDSKIDNAIKMNLPIAKGNLSITYSLVPNSYLVNMEVRAEDLEGFFPVTTNELDITWNEKLPQQEKGYSFENTHSSISYRNTDGDTEVLSSMGADEEENEFDEDEKYLIWIAYK